MRAATLTGVEEMEVEQRDRPVPGSDEVLVQVGACGVCMTDYHMYHGSFAVETPLVLGHESAGTIVQRGEGVTGFEEGDRVAINPVVPCNACSACKRGNSHHCEENTSIGGAGQTVIDDAFAEYVRVPATNVEDIGELPFQEAALAEPLACCLHGVERCGIEQGDSVALIGAGPIGLLLLQTLRNRGGCPIVVSEPDPDRRQLAAELGADIVVDPRETDPVEAIREPVGNVDVAIEVVGTTVTIKQAHRVTATGGNTLIFGVPAQEETMDINPFEIYFEEIDLKGTYALNQVAFERAVSLLQWGRIDAETLVTEEIALEEIPLAFEQMAATKGLKKIVRPTKP